MEEDERIVPMLKNMEKQDFGNNYSTNAAGKVRADNVDTVRTNLFLIYFNIIYLNSFFLLKKIIKSFKTIFLCV
jgi:hypothetical protein